MAQDVHVKLSSGCYGKIGIHQEEDTFHRQTGFTFKEEATKVLRLGYTFIWC
jgi:hypothetical protein